MNRTKLNILHALGLNTESSMILFDQLQDGGYRITQGRFHKCFDELVADGHVQMMPSGEYTRTFTGHVLAAANPVQPRHT